jgi:hypothetical protein
MKSIVLERDTPMIGSGGHDSLSRSGSSQKLGSSQNTLQTDDDEGWKVKVVK